MTSQAPEPREDQRFVAHARTVMALTLLSRISGMIRDAVCSRVFGTSAAWSAFVTAFIVPNLFRRLFGEGAISAAFIPEYAKLREKEPDIADRLASLTVAVVLALLGVIVILLEVGVAIALLVLPDDAPARTILVYLMVMLPFAPLVCATAILGGILQTHGRFVPHAAAPIILNACMIAAAATLGLWLDAPLERTALAISAAVLVAGALQLAWCAASLRGIVHWTSGVRAAHNHFRAMLRRFIPVVIGMGTLQFGTLLDGLIAGWPLLFGPILFAGIAYPLDTGAAATLFFASRLYQFPLGVFGIAIATAIFPALSRAADNPDDYLAILRRGIRTSLFISLPATIGLLLVARTAAAVIYMGGEFDQQSLDRVTFALLAFSPAVWAYSLTHVLTRAFYARGDTTTPMRVGIATVALNLTLNLILIWPLREAGLALATSIAAVAQCLTLTVLGGRLLTPPTSRLFDRDTTRSILLTLAASLAMLVIILAVRLALPISTHAWAGHFLALLRDTLTGGAAFLAIALLTKRPELGWLAERAPKPPQKPGNRGAEDRSRR